MSLDRDFTVDARTNITSPTLPGVSGPRLEGFATTGDRLGIRAGAGFRGATLGLEVHVHEAEPLGEPVRPLQVVEQRPGEIPPDVHAHLYRRRHGLEVAAQVLHPQRVVAGAVCQGGRVVESGPVL